MVLPALSFVLLLFSALCAADINKPLDCWKPSAEKGNLETCSQPVDDVVAVVPGASYVAKIECKDCPYTQYTERGGHKIVKSDQILFMNLTLSHDNRTALLDDRPIYPLQTIPSPPDFYVTQYPSTFSNKNLSSGLECSNPYCGGIERSPNCVDWCWNLALSSVRLDYLYTVKPTEYDGPGKDADALYWEVALDVIGGHSWYQDDPDWKFDDPSQKMLWVLFAGKEVKKDNKGGRNTNTASDLFGPVDEKEKIYEYQIVDLRLEARAYTFPPEKPLTLWAKIGRFFGNDVWEAEGRFIYRGKEWDYYGKHGTLRKMFGDFVHWDFWYLFWIISGSTVAGLIALFGIYKLFFWLVQQRELAKWDGMDDVWDNLRREPPTEEEDALLDGAYRDDPDEGGSSRPPRYTDEPSTMKPLPSKPLPEKPLPEVPLIDA